MAKLNKTSLENLICELQKYDKATYSQEIKSVLNCITEKIIKVGSPAVPSLIKLLNNYQTISCEFAIYALGQIGDEKALQDLLKALEHKEAGKYAETALLNFGEKCVPLVIKQVEKMILSNYEEFENNENSSDYCLSFIGNVKCEESCNFLNKLLDEYMSEMPKEEFDPSKQEWKFKYIDFFHLLDCMVKQQDDRSIPHIKKARDFFPEIYTDYKICQIAIGRIKKRRKDEGYLPLEALDIAYPSGSLMNFFSGGELGWEDDFDEKYGEYFDDDDD